MQTACSRGFVIHREAAVKGMLVFAEGGVGKSSLVRGAFLPDNSTEGLSAEEAAQMAEAMSQMVEAQEILAGIDRQLDVEEALTRKLLQRYGL